MLRGFKRVVALVVLLFSLNVFIAEARTPAELFNDFVIEQGDSANPSNTLPYYNFLNRFVQATNSGSGTDIEVVTHDIIIEGVNAFVIIISALALLFVIIAGFRMVTSSGNEDEAKRQGTTIRNIVIGIVLMNTANLFVSTVFFNREFINTNITSADSHLVELLGKFCEGDATSMTTSGASDACNLAAARLAPINLSNHVVFPVMEFFLGFLAAFAVLYIIIAAFRIINARGEGDAVKDAYRSIINGLIGLAMILLSQQLVGAVYGVPFTGSSRSATVQALRPEILNGISLVMSISNYILGFFAVIAVVMFMYSGALVLFAGVNEESRKKGFTIMKWTVAGLVLAMAAYAITATLVRLNT